MIMGRTIPSFRLACVAEELKWRRFRSRLNKDDRKKFDEMFSTSRLYNSACVNSSRPIVLDCIMMAITLHHFKQVTALMKKNKHNIPRTKNPQEIK
jgi:hypothetical protein